MNRRRNGKKEKWNIRQFFFIQNGSKGNTIAYVFKYKNTEHFHGVNDDSGGLKLLFVIWTGDFFQCGLHAPDLTGVLGDGAIAGELTTAGNVVNRLLGPFFGVLTWV